MTEPTTDQPQGRKPVFIENIFPVKLLNQQVYYDNTPDSLGAYDAQGT
jgi:hypothetical protein